MTFPPLIIWAKATFFFEQLFPVVARTWLGYRSDRLFLGPKFRFLVQKSDFCHTTPILVNYPFLAPGMTVNFPPWERFFDFPTKNTKEDGTHADAQEEEQELAIELRASGLIKPRHENDNSGGRHHMVIVFIWLALL